MEHSKQRNNCAKSKTKNEREKKKKGDKTVGRLEEAKDARVPPNVTPASPQSVCIGLITHVH